MVQRVRIRYAKRGPMRFTSHRDFARALERAILRAKIPIAYSQGFSPHPKISYASAAPTGVASEAEYLEIGLRSVIDIAGLARRLDAALPPGLDVLTAVDATGGSLADRIEASHWRVELPGVTAGHLGCAVTAFLAATTVEVERLTKHGRRTIDARGPVVRLTVVEEVGAAPFGVGDVRCAILDLVVRQVSPVVRPDDVLSGLRVLADLELSAPPRATRMAQGVLTAASEIIDPFVVDRDSAVSGSSSVG